MSKTVVGLFDNARDAEDVRSDLQSMNLSSADIDMVSQDSLGDQSTMLSRLSSAGVPEDDARLYYEGVRRGGSLVVAQVDDSYVNDVVDVMHRHNIVDLESRRASYSTIDADADTTSFTATTTAAATDYTTTDRTDYATTDRTVDTGDTINVPIVEEEIQVGKREVERGGVRVNVDVEEVPVEEQVTVRDETVRVERRPVDREVSGADLDAFQEGAFEVRETDEEAVVGKQARVVEEVVIRKDVEERTETIRDTVRRTDVDVEEVGGTTRTTGTTSSAGYTTGSTTGERDRSLTDRIEGATGMDIDRDGDVDDRTRNR